VALLLLLVAGGGLLVLVAVPVIGLAVSGMGGTPVETVESPPAAVAPAPVVEPTPPVPVPVPVPEPEPPVAAPSVEPPPAPVATPVARPVRKPVTDKPVTDKPVTDKPVTDKPVATPPPVTVHTTTRVVFDGSIPLQLRSGITRFSPGEVPADDYEIWADFGDGLALAGRVSVLEGHTVKLRCNRLMATCGEAP
jgi:hypothetical protein